MSDPLNCYVRIHLLDARGDAYVTRTYAGAPCLTWATPAPLSLAEAMALASEALTILGGPVCVHRVPSEALLSDLDASP